MEQQQPRIRFKELKGFPSPEEKLETVAFLESSKEIVGIIVTFGKLFSPVINDMNGNIKKLTKCYEKDPKRFQYLEDLIVLNIEINDKVAPDALLWLKRGLMLICIFFENVLYDAKRSDLLKIHLQDAYDKTLKPFHGFIVQSTVKIIYSWAPSRSQLIGVGPEHDENIEMLEVHLPKMRSHLNRIDALLKQHKFDS